MKRLVGVVSISLYFGLTGCSSGDLRMLSDGLAAANGYQVTYPDQSDVEYVGDIRWTTGIRYGNGFMKVDNMGGEYCKVRIDFEGGSSDYYYLDPYEKSGDVSISVYDQPDYLDMYCHSTDVVFQKEF